MTFTFSISDGPTFRPVTEIPWKKGYFNRNRLDSGESLSMIDELVFQAGMIELVSYWKAACPPVVKLPPGRLTEGQLTFWKKLYFNGLGEFFHTNSIPADPSSFMNIETSLKGHPEAVEFDLQGPALIPVGGGKDSALTLGLAKQIGEPWIPLAINPMKASREVILASGKNIDDMIIIHRAIDPLLLKLNDEGYLNGHTPFSAAVAFYSLLAAFLSGSGSILLSNESSANEATIPGTSINHQYSKTFEFETDFRRYTRDFITPSINYFSLLRPLTELQIADLFSGHPEYFGVFRSCNAGSKSGRWCGKCPKCLFTWIILSPFLSQEQLRNIFSHDLLQDSSLKETLDELCGISESKPFECVGTIGEVNLALNWLLRQYRQGDLPELLRYYSTVIPSGDYSGEAFHAAMACMNHDHYVPEKYIRLITGNRHA